MRAGTLRDRISIEQYVTAEDALGAAAKTWQAIGEVQAQIMEQQGGREFSANVADVAEGTTRIRFRETPTIHLDPAMRLVDVDRGDIYEIISIVPSRTRNDITVNCKHGGAKR
jgi:head-tail adaptor